jgi:transcriptional regulator with XRE-family HTH domain
MKKAPKMSSARGRLAWNVLRLRREAGLTQEELGARLDIHFTFVGSIERGERNVTIDNIERVAKALKVDIAELFRG